MSSSRCAFPTGASIVSAAWAESAWGSPFPFPFGFDDILISFFLMIVIACCSALRLPFSCRIPRTLSDSALHNQHRAEPRFALDHASVGIGSLFEKKCLDHRTDVLQDAEGKRVLAINRRARQTAMDRAPSKHKRECIQLDLVLRYTDHDELPTGCKTGHK